MTEAEAVKIALPRGTLKLLAQYGAMPGETARHLLYRKWPTSGRQGLAMLLLAEMYRQDREERALAKKKLAQMAGFDAVEASGDESNPTTGAMVGGIGCRVAAAAGDDPPSSLRLRLARRLAEFARGE